jgi:hypothetical protein
LATIQPVDHSSTNRAGAMRSSVIETVMFKHPVVLIKNCGSFAPGAALEVAWMRALNHAPLRKQDQQPSCPQGTSARIRFRITAQSKKTVPIQMFRNFCTVLALSPVMRSYDLKRGAPNTCLSMKC